MFRHMILLLMALGGLESFCEIYGIKGTAMKKYVCDVCGYVYDPEVGDPENGVATGTAFEDISDDWVCPECGVGKDQFSPEE